MPNNPENTHYVGNKGWLVHNCGIIGETRGLEHSFDRHAHEWWGMSKPVGEAAKAFEKTYGPQWQALLERAAQSSNVVKWSTGNDPTLLHLAYIDGKYFAVQFYTSGSRAGELATAFIPNAKQLAGIKSLLGK